ncbi:glycosyltransferase family 4 protein [Psychrobacter sp. Ps5]|nr:glycosyltransferase family 4 protein [Psychrobacter sp. Ps5]MCG3860924.1 glycosyltransferase family 4 protein [Psychrobacter sp. Ps5]
MKKKNIFIIGYFGFVTNQLDGQTVKTRNVLEVLKEKYTVGFYDTENLKNNKVSFLQLLWEILKYENVFFIGGRNNLQYFFPILFLISKVKRGKIVYVVVGGWLYDFLKSSSYIYTYMVKNISSVLVETNYLENELSTLGLKNTSWIPNFRIRPYNKLPKVKIDTDTLKIVFMARITKPKGIYLLFEFIEQYLKNPANYNKKIIIDFYGPIKVDDELVFKGLVDKYSSHVNYKGILEPTEIYQVLPHYDVLVLPTFYEGEGFPGAILDAYLCGLPVITTRWKQIPEFVEENHTGFLIDYDVEQLGKKIQSLANNAELLTQMKSNAYRKSRQYSADIGLEVLEKTMGL